MTSPFPPQKQIMATFFLAFACLLSSSHASMVMPTECTSDMFHCVTTEDCIDSSWQCDAIVDCTDGSDEDNCTDDAGCPSTAFKCASSDICLPVQVSCNGSAECPDGSDEENCGSVTVGCNVGEFECEGNGQCIPWSWRCDDYGDCDGATDEENCSVTVGCNQAIEFECEGSGECIPWWWQCDDDVDCDGGSDEENCSLNVCERNVASVQCEDQEQCIPWWEWCDEKVDCDDGSDEEDCDSWHSSVDVRCADDYENGCTCGDQFVISHWWCDCMECCGEGFEENDTECSGIFEPRGCLSTEFECETSGICVPLSRVCDTINDCFDNSDEACGLEPSLVALCLLEDFECWSGSCVSEAQRCDGVSDCDDSSDEIGCECSSFEFQCGSTLRCVRQSRKCDGVMDCDDASDEHACGSCADQGLWECDSGECINNTSVCDGDRDCSSGKDEANCQPPCNGFQFECDGKCWPRYYLCDTFEHCSGGEDEDYCVFGGCGVHQFSCEDGSCLLEAQFCDTHQDCSGGEDEEDCGDPTPPGFPLGMASWYIPDVYITASSEYKPDLAPHLARAGQGSCWVLSSFEDQWLQVYFGKTTNVTGVVISGGGDKWDLASWVTSFTLAFSMDGASWTPYKDSINNTNVFQGNRDRYNKVSRPLQHPVTSRYIRLYPTGYEGWVAVAMEVYVTDGEDTWLLEEYVPLGVGFDSHNPRAVPKISDYAITASSRGDGLYPRQARLNNGRGQQEGACWSPAPDMETGQWLQIEHDGTYQVVGVITQGAYNLDYWVTSYMLTFSLDGETWTLYTNSAGEEMVFQGNVDSHRYVRNLLNKPVVARYTRFYPLTFHNQIALRVEILITELEECEEYEVLCAGRCRAKGRLCPLFAGCVPHKYRRGEKPICEDILHAECGIGSNTELDELWCLEINSQFRQCDNDNMRKRSDDVYHNTQACDGTAHCSNGKDEEDCGDIDCVIECSTESGDPCIPNGWLCDDIPDCLDSKDEQACGQETSKAKECFFVCDNSTECLPTRQLGDGYPDCANGQDEDTSIVEVHLEGIWLHCGHTCMSVYGNASCVPGVFVCDGDVDCLDVTDELGCESDCMTFTCNLPNIPKPSCLPDHLICDGHGDCVRGEDEQGCDNIVAQISTTPTIGQQPPEEENVDQATIGGQTVNQEPSPTNDEGSFEEEPGLNAGSHGTNVQAKIWMVAAALGIQIFSRHTTY